MNWNNVFSTCYQKQPGLPAQELQCFTESWHLPLSEAEKQEITGRQRNPFPAAHPLHAQYTPFDPGLWSIPQKGLPPSYLDFLRYSDGGEFGNGGRYFQFFSAGELRSMLLAYEFPEYMPGAVPFAMDGSGNHYIWDMRGYGDKDQEYPILVSHSGSLGYEDSIVVARSFPELCRGTTAVDDELNG
ncbi:SMI1/KNR4 family protein [Paenibacillus sp. PK3_47]|uniref:SMI1/KNR4 family protein n=1 Tax=Paenibacillus sp. PK3_47 TaxID=2072642 RepID=UPI00201D693F|nr:SMI1/KNR4 family protein [Paenibacillus sp. PK3_47]UQZ34937.1 SMI1/KNR4 family protein [Paenibacillus sp. PK3_47]